MAAQRNVENASLGVIIDRIEADEDSAWAIFTPPRDVRGLANADGHEVDLFARDGRRRAYFWAYTFDPAAQTVQRYRYTPGGRAIAIGAPAAGITAFRAETYDVAALRRAGTRISSPLYSGAQLQPATVPLEVASMPALAGGNAITWLRIVTPSAVRDLQLSTQTAPSGFTIVLDYTPPPAGALNVDPAEIVFTSPLPIGGSSGRCAGAYAYRGSSGHYTLDADDLAIGTDRDGCFHGVRGVNAVAAQPRYTGAFRYDAGSCAHSLLLGAFAPARGAAIAALPLGLQSPPPQGGCAFSVLSDNGSQTLRVAVAPPCAFVGQSCAFQVHFPDDGPGCEPGPGGYIADGYDGSGTLIAAPSSDGTVEPRFGSGTFTFTRTAVGAVRAEEMARYVRFTRLGSRCASTFSFVRIGTFDIPSQ